MTTLKPMIAMLLVAAVTGYGRAWAGDVPPSGLTPSDPAHAPSCLKDTGTRIPRKAGQCSATGHSYTDNDIKQTGATSVGGALRLLDPSITIHN